MGTIQKHWNHDIITFIDFSFDRVASLLSAAKTEIHNLFRFLPQLKFIYFRSWLWKSASSNLQASPFSILQQGELWLVSSVQYCVMIKHINVMMMMLMFWLVNTIHPVPRCLTRSVVQAQNRNATMCPSLTVRRSPGRLQGRSVGRWPSNIASMCQDKPARLSPSSNVSLSLDRSVSTFPTLTVLVGWLLSLIQWYHGKHCRCSPWEVWLCDQGSLCGCSSSAVCWSSSPGLPICSSGKMSQYPETRVSGCSLYSWFICLIIAFYLRRMCQGRTVDPNPGKNAKRSPRSTVRQFLTRLVKLCPRKDAPRSATTSIGASFVSSVFNNVSNFTHCQWIKCRNSVIFWQPYFVNQ